MSLPAQHPRRASEERDSASRLEQATEAMNSALRTGDLNALGEALRARKAAIEAGAVPTREAFEAGEFALATLAAMKRRWAADSARIEQIRASLTGALQRRPRVNFDYRG